VSLASLARHFEAGEKGKDAVNNIGKRRADFTPEELSVYGDYCINDVVLTRSIFDKMMKEFPESELHVINHTLKMYTEPVLRLDTPALRQHLKDIILKKAQLLHAVGMTPETVMSNQKFANALTELGVEPPMKISPTTGKPALALAKNDEDFLTLQNHPNLAVQAMVAARLGVKSTLEETRTERFIAISERGTLPIPLKYYAAHTGRWGGSESINMQNLPSRGSNAKKLKKAVLAPPGFLLIDADSSQIEARVLAWLAGQDDVVEAFREKKDVYRQMASAIYNKPESEITDGERFIGKTAVLGCGYGLGAEKLQVQLKTAGVGVSIDEARRIIVAYRSKNHAIVALWKQAKLFIEAIERGDHATLGRPGVLECVPEKRAIRLPNGLLMAYEDLSRSEGPNGLEYTYKTRNGRTRIYGGKLIENVCQALAACIIKFQLVKIADNYKVVMTVHDAVAAVVPEVLVQTAKAFIEDCMRTAPDWAQGLPLNCESGFGPSYGDC
jgi:DNA polymerase